MAEKKPLAEIADLLQEDRTFPPPEAFRAQALVCDESVYARADRDPEGFWAAFASELEWYTPWTKVLDWQPPHAKWFAGAIARPDDVIFTADLPKTRSGKIMRRLLRDIAEGKALGDTTTLPDPNVVAKLKEQYQDEH